MPDLLQAIQARLNSPRLREDLTPLFCETLLWGRPQGRGFDREVTVGQDEKVRLTFVPVAQLSGLPVFRVDWPASRLPTIMQRRAVHCVLAPAHVEHLLAYVTNDDRQATFVWARRRPRDKVEMRALPYAVGSPARTTIEQLGKLAFTLPELGLFGEPPVTAASDKLNAAFDVEAVTRRFFTTYRAVFEATERQITGITGDARRLFTQRLFNRLMFLAFLERKGWLTFNRRQDYLRTLWEDYRRERQMRPDTNFYRDRLKLLFFSGLNTPHEVNIVGIQPGGFLQTLIGDVPYLNGGLFEEDDDDRNPAITVPDEAVAPALDELFYRFNFTVTESTPLDLEVAVDPEMLGKIFEELVTGRHETGSYYTPKPVVSFMCREALEGYLEPTLWGESPAAIQQFVDEHDAAALRDPESALDALRRIKVCDPACGSGAYLLGMLHELLDLRACLFAARQLDAKTVYERKLEIIQHNLYGVDIDPFAVNIARLRLWLSLVVDFEGNDPPPLPNLDFKIETGDSLTAPSPEKVKQQAFRDELVNQFREKKAEFMRTHHYGEKQRLREEIAQLRQKIAEWTYGSADGRGFDWAVEFAEVFTGGGFDIVLANPPYARQELLGRDYKENQLKPVFPEAYTGMADLYVYFYARAHQLLKLGGVACFISSNKWLRAGYGEKLRQHLLDAQAFHLVLDFGELPVFEAAATFPAIFLWQKQPRGNTPTTWAVVKDLQACYDEGIREYIAHIAQTVPASQFGKGKPRLAASTAADRRARMESSGPRLAELVKGHIYRGVVTGFNEAFIVDRATRERLIDEDPKSAEIIKPLLMGDDVRRYELHYRERYLIFTRRGVNIRRYPAILKYLTPFRADLTPKKSSADKRGRKPGTYEWYEIQDTIDYYTAFPHPKIMYPEIGKEARFGMDFEGYYPADTVHIIVHDDWYLLGVLNSTSVFEYLKGTCSVLGDEDNAGRLRFKPIYVETLAIPDSSKAEQKAVAKLAQEAQRLHTQRWQRVEQFLCDIGTSAAQSSSRNPLEQPWWLTPEEFARRVKGVGLRVFTAVRDETAELTEQIERVEREIDERVAGLYGL